LLDLVSQPRPQCGRRGDVVDANRVVLRSLTRRVPALDEEVRALDGVLAPLVTETASGKNPGVDVEKRSAVAPIWTDEIRPLCESLES
jgi:hypothetical protein